MLVTFLFVVFSAFLAALLRGFTGFGFAIAAVPLLSLVLPPARVVPLTVVLQVLASLVDLRAASRITDWRSMVWLTPGMVVGTPLGLFLLTRLSANDARLTIGVLILGSGNVVHNLNAFIWGRQGGGLGDSAEVFDTRVKELVVAGDYGALIHYESLGREAAFAVPTPEHYYPLL